MVEILGYQRIMFKKTKDPLNEHNVILINFVVDFLKSQKL
jgi:hypothetical protein